MQNLMINRRARFGLLPTAVFWLALGVSFATVGQAEDALETTTVTARAVKPVGYRGLNDAMRDQTEEAVWKTRISVATDLSARLNGQHRPLRLASRYQGVRG